MQNVFVFDIDETLAHAICSYSEEASSKRIALYDRVLGKDFRLRHSARAFGDIHMVYPGFHALFRWIRERGDLIHFFSAGYAERNVELVDNVMAIAFGNESEEVLKNVRVFSRDDAVITDFPKENERCINFQPENKLLNGRLKKKLEGLVVDTGQLPWTLLIDDDRSYTTRGEEMNFFNVCGYYDYYCEYDGMMWDRDKFDNFHKAYNIRGALEEILDNVARQGITLAQAASEFRVKIEDKYQNPRGELSFPYFESGLKLLSEYDPELKFYFPLPQSTQD